MPIISVILPIYNIKEEYLETCIQSVCRQTLDDIEIILV
ncbi:TPA: glycosyltransferase, partial [Klebsiella pneumoniae]|nr:glycosyltransferase [Klebsiella pneumoniae]